MKVDLMEALNFINPAQLSYAQWLSIGMSLKAEGYSVDVWDEWSKADERYNNGVCKAKWDTFNGSGITGATITKLAMDNGYSPTSKNQPMPWDDIIDLKDINQEQNKNPAEQLTEYINVLFKPNEYVGIITNDSYYDSKDKKWKPKRGEFNQTAKQILDGLKKHPDDIAWVVGDWHDEAGAWIRINPLDGVGATKQNVTRFEHVLVECDEIPIEEQIAQYKRLKLPIATLVTSAGRSVHAVVKINASTYEEYTQRVRFLFDYLSSQGIKIDDGNKDPGRMSRMPGATRNGKMQTLLATNVGFQSWNEWYEYIQTQNGIYGYEPADYTDLGQAIVLASKNDKKMKYNSSVKFLVYQDGYWQESEEMAQRQAQLLTDKQLSEAETKLKLIKKRLDDSGTLKIVADKKRNESIEDILNEEQIKDVQEMQKLDKYKKFILQMRNSKYISATMKEVKPLINIQLSKLNNDPFLLNTPTGTYNLKKGIKGLQPHNPNDYITKMTSVSPSNKGKALWKKYLKATFKDEELINYVQQICGMAAIGKVFVEAMIISYGDGCNGKSTFWNTIFRVLGTYSGKISADVLSNNTKRNIKPEMAELFGKRFVIASESENNAKLNESIIKQLCSTDEIVAEKKFKDPFSFKPTHMLMLYTNHLPKIADTDDGIWRRVILIPFNQKITEQEDIKNYADYLYEKAGEYILAWIIDGARLLFNANFKLNQPEIIKNSIKKYKKDSDWFTHFLEDCCDLGENYQESSQKLYVEYRNYSFKMGEKVHSTTDFNTFLAKNGFKKVEIDRKRVVLGIKFRGFDE